MGVILRQFAIFTFVLIGHAVAGPIYQPVELNPGDTYRLIFVTNTTITPVSGNISDYNNFVATAAAQSGLDSLNTTWTALVSTSSINALDNAGLSTQDSATTFYNTQGQKIAEGVIGNPHSLYDDNGFTVHYNPIYDPQGTTPSTHLVWTGTRTDGTSSFFALGGIRSAIAGRSDAVNLSWTTSDNTFYSPGTIYGVSGVLTVSQTPEPGTIGVVGVGFALLLALHVFREA